MWWREPITKLKGIGAKKAADFANINVLTIGDLLNNYPRTYIDQSKIKTIADLSTNGDKQLFSGEIYRISDKISARRLRYTLVTLVNNGYYADVYLYGSQRYQARSLKIGDKLLVTAKIQPGRNVKVASDANIQKIKTGEESQAPGILPIYGLSGSLTQNVLRSAVKMALQKAEEYLPETLPQEIVEYKRLQNRLQALKEIHFPSNFIKLKEARERFIFEELFLLQCGLSYYRGNIKETRPSVKMGADGETLSKVLNALPFKLTEAQENAWRDINNDMQDKKPMHRLLQGDVGSGKTAVAALALAKAAENGYQSCIMVPTEILANQHYETLSELLGVAGFNVALLTGSVKTSRRNEILNELQDGTIDVLVGTHALIQEDVRFKHLALVITDEQHRFGVEQRAKLTDKSLFAPDILVMTATPIPRTLALTVYGDLNVTNMKGLPPGRKEIKTLCYTGEKRHGVYEGLVRQVNEGRQAYVVCAAIEPGELPGVKSAVELFNELKDTYLKNIPAALLHGKMKVQEKDNIMTDFALGKIKVLVSTTVIEVGVNVPNASLMIIENADRFGLAQMHQLRGRVGRGDVQSYCVLLTDSDNPDTLARLNVLHTSTDGFYLAEKDLELRGAGQLFGLRQHGLPDLYIADILRDTEVLLEARKLAKYVLANEELKHKIKDALSAQFDERFERIFNS